jgi:RimJ/RimL family protein N-acetyltransferase
VTGSPAIPAGPAIPPDPLDTVTTPRLVLRAWEPTDLDPLTEIWAQREVWEFPLHRGLTAEETARWLERQLARQQEPVEPLLRAACDRSTGTLLGFIGLSVPTFLPEILPAVEVGWRLDPQWWGRGLATEGARALVAYGFDQLGLTRIWSIYEPENSPSGRVMDKLGMHLERETTHPELGVPLRVLVIDRPAAGDHTRT